MVKLDGIHSLGPSIRSRESKHQETSWLLKSKQTSLDPWPSPNMGTLDPCVDHGTFLCFSHVSLYSRRSTIDPTQQSLRLTRAKMPEVNKFRFISPGLSPETSHGSGGTKWGLWGILKTSLLCYSWRVNCNIQLQKRTCGLIILNICILFWIV